MHADLLKKFSFDISVDFVGEIFLNGFSCGNCGFVRKNKAEPERKSIGADSVNSLAACLVFLAERNIAADDLHLEKGQQIFVYLRGAFAGFRNDFVDALASFCKGKENGIIKFRFPEFIKKKHRRFAGKGRILPEENIPDVFLKINAAFNKAEIFRDSAETAVIFHLVHCGNILRKKFCGIKIVQLVKLIDNRTAHCSGGIFRKDFVFGKAYPSAAGGNKNIAVAPFVFKSIAEISEHRSVLKNKVGKIIYCKEKSFIPCKFTDASECNLPGGEILLLSGKFRNSFFKKPEVHKRIQPFRRKENSPFPFGKF